MDGAQLLVGPRGRDGQHSLFKGTGVQTAKDIALAGAARHLTVGKRNPKRRGLPSLRNCLHTYRRDLRKSSFRAVDQDAEALDRTD